MKLGLNSDEVIKSRKENGTNELPEYKRRTIINLIIESLGDPIIKILLIALAIKVIFLFKDFNWYETLGILIAIFLATLISTLSEYGSEEAFKKLQNDNKNIIVKVYRNNVLKNININDVVVGDTILTEPGEIIPADGVIISGELLIDESSLTGESEQLLKIKNDKVMRGSTVHEGTAKILVKYVGIDTSYGKIYKELGEKPKKSPLKERLLKLSKIINRIGYIGAAFVVLAFLFSVIFISNNFNKMLIINYLSTNKIINDLIYALTLCVTIIVVAVPEGLPMMITLVLSSNMKKLIKSNVLVKKMVGIETSGNIDYLLTDKTGTITIGKLKMVKYISSDLCSYNKLEDIKNTEYRNYILESLIYNNSSIIENNEVIGGNETDKAITFFIKNLYYKKSNNNEYKPFSSSLKYSKCSFKNHNYIKGAYDILINDCNYELTHNNTLIPINKKKIINTINKYTSDGYRVIINIDNINSKNIFLGIIIIKDEIRDKSVEGINNIKKAGVNIIMITGDHNNTATSIAKEVGIISSNSDISLNSSEFNKMTDEEITNNISRIKVISRALPSDKSRLVKILQNSNHIVGMTGDGVNDAPALKKADVGFAMGSGTSVAKEAADIVILDNNLLSISKAILFGRTIFKSIRKFVVYQLSVNFGALIVSIIGPFIGVNTPITIVQMLWLNMIMDTFSGLAFSFEPPLSEYLDEKPISIFEPILSKKMIKEIIINSFTIGLVCIFFLKCPIVLNYIRNDNKYFMTAYFGLFIFMGIVIAFCARTSSINILKNIKENKIFIILFSFIIFIQILIIYFGGSIFNTYGLNGRELIFIIVLSFIPLITNTIRKIIDKKART